ncbi:MAG: hypothetical protein HQL22_08190 [Candidatus Omnitrophica bacterium]|nr:hypothetical protein [Candidatus Omnitrophota bacterium]
MRSKNNGQSILEYVILATIIFLGIIIGGPTLMKAVQGYFKLTDESIQDATSENIQQAGKIIPGKNCTCSVGAPADTNPTSWTKGQCGVGSCTATQRYYYRTCSPLKCAQEEACLTEDTCCTEPTPVSCGIQTAVTSRQTVDKKFADLNDGYTGTVNNSSQCAVGERLYKIVCGVAGNATASTTVYACKQTQETQLSCLPTCWDYPFLSSRPCNGSMAAEMDTNKPTENDQVVEDGNSIPNSITERTTLIDEVKFRLSDENTLPRVLSNNVEVADILRFNQYRTHYTYLLASQCSNKRYCERLCPGGFSPNPKYQAPTPGDDQIQHTVGIKGKLANETCVQDACWYGWWPKGPYDPHTFKTNKTIEAHQECGSTAKPQICPDDNEICGYLAICSSPDGAYFQTSDGPMSENPPKNIKKLDDSSDSCDQGFVKVFDVGNNLAYCYMATPTSTPLQTMPRPFDCSTTDNFINSPGNAKRTLFFTVFGCSNNTQP